MQSGQLMCTRGRGRVGQARQTSAATSPASLLHGSCLGAGACTQAHLCCASSTSFRVFLVTLACRRLHSSPAAYPVHAVLSFSSWSVLPAPEPLGQLPCPPLFSPVSLTSWRLCPGPPTIFSYLIIIPSHLPKRQPAASATWQASKRVPCKSSCQALSPAWPTPPRPIFLAHSACFTGQIPVPCSWRS